MNIRKLIKEEARKIFLSENYPMGAQHDPNAPWNQESNVRAGEKAENINYELIWTDDSEFAFFKDASGNVYVCYIDGIDREDLRDYADREESFEGYDEDGDPMVDYSDDWEIDGEVIQNYINSIDPSVGKGLDDYESAEYDLVLLDDALRADLMSVSAYMDEKHKQSFIDVVSGNINESGVTDIVNQETMDTPTGSIFMMSMGESKKK